MFFIEFRDRTWEKNVLKLFVFNCLYSEKKSDMTIVSLSYLIKVKELNAYNIRSGKICPTNLSFVR